MLNLNAIFQFFKNWIQIIFWFIKSKLTNSIKKDLEILALRSQLSILQQNMINNKISKPNFRQLCVLLSKIFSNWQESLIIVKPETVVKWHKNAFKIFWKFQSKKRGRPKISPATIALIKRIHKENPLISPEKIHKRLVSLNISDAPAPNTITKYIPKIGKPPTEKHRQSWQTFLRNHSKGIWAMDFMVVPTLFFKVLYVLVIINHDRRKIEHIAVTSNPTSLWVAQQIREATHYGEIPKYLIHLGPIKELTVKHLFLKKNPWTLKLKILL